MKQQFASLETWIKRLHHRWAQLDRILRIEAEAARNHRVLFLVATQDILILHRIIPDMVLRPIWVITRRLLGQAATAVASAVEVEAETVIHQVTVVMVAHRLLVITVAMEVHRLRIILIIITAGILLVEEEGHHPVHLGRLVECLRTATVATTIQAIILVLI